MAGISSSENYTYSLTTEDYENLLSFEVGIGGNETYKYFIQPEDSGNEPKDSGNGPSFVCEISPASQGCMHLQERDPRNLSVKGHIKKTADRIGSKHFKLRGLKRHHDRDFLGGNHTRHNLCHRPACGAFGIRSTFTIKPLAHGHSNVNETTVMTERALATEITNRRKRTPGCDENSSDRTDKLACSVTEFSLQLVV